MLLQFEYFYGSEAEDFTFYRIPKKIVTSPCFKDVSYGAKMLYGLLFDRVGLFIKNSWFDDENRAYIIFSIQEIMESMYCSKPTAVKFMAELEDAGLIERKKRGRGPTDYIYVKKVVDNEKVVKNVDHKELKDFISDGQEIEPQEVRDFNPIMKQRNDPMRRYISRSMQVSTTTENLQRILATGIFRQLITVYLLSHES